uniref:Uncharacterized protein n=1 Tax=Plectus sambesii TaxID=2011161 RepID=A0A914W3N5_9BILA
MNTPSFYYLLLITIFLATVVETNDKLKRPSSFRAYNVGLNGFGSLQSKINRQYYKMRDDAALESKLQGMVADRIEQIRMSRSSF